MLNKNIAASGTAFCNDYFTSLTQYINLHVRTVMFLINEMNTVIDNNFKNSNLVLLQLFYARSDAEIFSSRS